MRKKNNELLRLLQDKFVWSKAELSTTRITENEEVAQATAQRRGEEKGNGTPGEGEANGRTVQTQQEKY